MAGLKSSRFENNVEKLWIEDGGRLENELKYLRDNLGDGHGVTNQIVIQIPKNSRQSILNSTALLYHLKVLQIATITTVEMFDVTWNLKDLCYTPSAPFFDKYHIDSLFENILPCQFITPLDCFWEGSKLLGPDVPVRVPGFDRNVQWIDLNPQGMVETMMAILKQSITASGSDLYASKQAFEPLEVMKKFMSQSGITTAYQEKPCLDPLDLNCPATAPNKLTLKSPNIGNELTDGCYGFATKYMHWIEDLIVGGVQKNRSGTIIKAKALQSIIQLMGEKNFYEYHQRTVKVQHIYDWSIEKARLILNSWQRKFSKELESFIKTTDFIGSQDYDVYVYTSNSFNEIIANFSSVNYFRLSLGYFLMLAYAGISLGRWRNKFIRIEKSISIVGMLGVFFIGFAIASGLGLCAFLGLRFNATTTQIIPLLSMALGIDNLLLLAYTYTGDYMINYVALEYRTAECLKQSGFSVMMSMMCNMLAFTAATLIPVPALRNFAIQTSILIAFIIIAVIVIFPSLMSINLHFRSLYIIEENGDSSFRNTWFLIDMCTYMLCGKTHDFSKSKSKKISSQSVEPPRSLFDQPYIYKQPYNVAYLDNFIATHDSIKSASIVREHSDRRSVIDLFKQKICKCETIDRYDQDSMHRCRRCGGDLRTQCDGQDEQHIHVESSFDETYPSLESNHNSSPIIVIPSNSEPCPSQRSFKSLFKTHISTSEIIGNYWAPFLQHSPVKFTVLSLYFGLVIIAIIGIPKINDGLDLADIVPRKSSEHRFLELREEYFSYYNIFAVTKGNFDYPNNQYLIYDYHQAFNRIDAIIKNDDGGMPEFWLSMFRDWLRRLQDAFDNDFKNGCITREQWFSNASIDGILAYKLLVQTGRIDNPVDKSLILTGRLVDKHGIINPKAFYNYLSAWTSNDILAYGSSQASFKPEPREWIHEAQDVELKIPKSPPLTLTQIPFHLNNLKTTEEIMLTIENIRNLCRRFEDRGLPNFPSGVPFTYWEQYFELRSFLIMSLLTILGGIFVSITVLMCSIRTPLIIVSILIINLTFLYGFMGWVGIKLSALPAVILTISVGQSFSSLIHITTSFISAIGDKNHRMLMALKHMANPVKHGIISTLFGLMMLAISEFDFVQRYFFGILGFSLLIVTLNSFFLLPIILSMIGPEADVKPFEYKDRISTPSPPPSPQSWPQVIYDPHSSAQIENFITEPRRSKPFLPTKSSLYYRYHQQRKELQRIYSQLSLSTISEESSIHQSSPTPTSRIQGISLAIPPDYQNNLEPISHVNTIPHELVVQPEFVVETTITNNNNGVKVITENGSSISSSSNETGSLSKENDDALDSSDQNGSIQATTTTTTTTSTNTNGNENQSSSTIVTTKVMATTKVKVHTPSPTPSVSTPITINQNQPILNLDPRKASHSTKPTQQSFNARHHQHPQPTTMLSFPGANHPQTYHFQKPTYFKDSYPIAPGYFVMPSVSFPQHYHQDVPCSNANCLIFNSPYDPNNFMMPSMNSNQIRRAPSSSSSSSSSSKINHPFPSWRK
ncbi:transmembrane protein [Sarcoptes scabiei]|nr:transmembrane protein [Sarcoptes scabiei]